MKKCITLDKSMIRLDEEFVVYFGDESLKGLANEVATLWSITMNASTEDNPYIADDGINAIISMVRRIKGLRIITIEDAKDICRLEEWRRQREPSSFFEAPSLRSI